MLRKQGGLQMQGGVRASRRSVHAWRRVMACIGMVLGAAGCPPSTPASTEVRVWVSSSLAAPLQAVVPAFEASHPGVHVVLRPQPENASVAVASASNATALAVDDERLLDPLRMADRTRTPVVFARDRIVLVTATGNTLVKSADDLTRPHLRVARLQNDAPVGASAREALSNLHVDDNADIRLETSEAAVLSDVQRGTVDVGLVRGIAARAQTGLRILDLPVGAAPALRHAIMPLQDEEPTHAFIAFLLSGNGQRVLRSSGFLPPDDTSATQP
jgi:ABC-type molybdate transport system substrate-binding protein